VFGAAPFTFFASTQIDAEAVATPFTAGAVVFKWHVDPFVGFVLVSCLWWFRHDRYLTQANFFFKHSLTAIDMMTTFQANGSAELSWREVKMRIPKHAQLAADELFKQGINYKIEQGGKHARLVVDLSNGRSRFFPLSRSTRPTRHNANQLRRDVRSFLKQENRNAQSQSQSR
jgi:hypothetical protein